jgi:enoyl-[acyl-carrier protein] reductase III
MADPLDFTGRRALVTGGSRGIGAVISRRLAAHGAAVFVNYGRDDRAAAALRDDILAGGGTATLARANVADPDALRSMIAGIGASGPIDILVHGAALGSFKPTVELKPPQWDLTMAVSARALLVAVQAARPFMPRGGRVVSLSSLGGARVIPDYGAIGVSKAAVESLTRYLAAELGPDGIGVNAVAAGLIEGSSISSHPSFDRLRQQALGRTPAGRLGRPHDVADAVVFLCSPLSGWVVGQTLVVDGGASLLA